MESIIANGSLNINELEKKIESTLKIHPDASVELTDLSEFAFDSLKRYFSGNYNVRGVITILSTKEKRTNYTLNITKKN